MHESAQGSAIAREAGARLHSGLLIGVTCWCPREADARARYAAASLEKLIAQVTATNPGWDIVIVDNDVQHPLLRAAMEAAEQRDAVTVVRLSPQRGWAGARNAQLDFFMRGAWSHLAMCDQDLQIADSTWIQEIETAAREDNLHGFMLVSDHSDLRGVIRLPSGRLAWVSREFLGGVHVVSRHAVETIGGYNVEDFPKPWGFHDCEYGLRLRAAGLLESSQGHYVDPVMRLVVHADTTSEDSTHSAMKRCIVKEFYPVFLRRAVEIQMGRRLYHPLTLRRNPPNGALTGDHP